MASPAADTGRKPAGGAATVDGARIIAADREPQNWLAHGRTYDEQRYSPLAKINDANVGELGLAWSYATGTTRGPAGEPDRRGRHDVHDWHLERRVGARCEDRPRDSGSTTRKCRAPGDGNLCCDAVNRGVAVWKGAVYVGTIDGRLVSLDAKTGAKRWEVNTIDRSKPYSITGAPRVVKGKVLIGNGGAEYGVRGYVSAYDADTGPARLAFLHGARQPEGRLRAPGARAGGEDLERRVVGRRRRRHGLGLDGLRPGTRHAVRRHRQRLAVGARHPLARRRRQPVPVVHPRARPGHGAPEVALPDDARRQLGLHGHAAHHPRGPDARRQDAQGADAGAEERLLLRDRPRDR